MKLKARQWLVLILLLSLVAGAWFWTTSRWQIPFWQHPDDYPALSLAHALNLEESLETRHRVMNLAFSVHPGLPYAIYSWLVFRAAQWGQPENQGETSWKTLQAPERFWRFNQIGALVLALVGTGLIWLFAIRYGEMPAIVSGILYYCLSSITWTSGFTNLSNESFALILAGVFFLIARRILSEDPPRFLYWGILGLWCGIGYLVKLNYIVLTAGAFVGLATAFLLGRYRFFETLTAGLTFLIGMATSLALGVLVMGWVSFKNLLRTHYLVAIHTKVYGTGETGIWSNHEIWAAMKRLADAPYLIAAVLLVTALTVWVVAKDWRTPERKRELPLLLMAVAVVAMNLVVTLKHYLPHYTLLTSAALPVAGALLLARFNKRLGGWLALGFCVLAITTSAIPKEMEFYNKYQQIANSANVDRAKVMALPINPGEYRLWTYHSPMKEFIIGFTAEYSGVERLKKMLREADSPDRSSYISRSLALPWRYIILDRRYYPDVEAVRRLDFYQPTDRLIELETVIVIDRTQGDRFRKWDGQ